MADTGFFFQNFCKTGPTHKDFLDKTRTMSKDFLWKNPFAFAQYVLCEYTPPPPAILKKKHFAEDL